MIEIDKARLLKLINSEYKKSSPSEGKPTVLKTFRVLHDLRGYEFDHSKVVRPRNPRGNFVAVFVDKRIVALSPFIYQHSAYRAWREMRDELVSAGTHFIKERYGEFTVALIAADAETETKPETAGQT